MTRTLARLSLAVLAALATAAAHPALAAEPAGGTLRGVVTDPSGAAVGQAQVAVSMAGAKRTVRTDARGAWSLPALRPGTYLVVVTRTGFAPFTQSGVAVAEGAETTVDAHLEIAPVKETVNVDENAAALGLSADQSAGAIVIEGAQLDALPDDPDDLVEALQALAGASAGPSGGEVFVDGFTGGRIPPKSAIRMIRLNASPFSAEYDRPGFGRIEILTKPGGDAFRGQMQRPLQRRRPQYEGPVREHQAGLPAPRVGRVGERAAREGQGVVLRGLRAAQRRQHAARQRHGARAGLPAGPLQRHARRAADPHDGQPAPRPPDRPGADDHAALLVHEHRAAGTPVSAASRFRRALPRRPAASTSCSSATRS